MKLGFSLQIFEKSPISSFIEICPVVAELFHVSCQMDRQADMMMLIVTFHNFVNMPKKNLFPQKLV
jgi:hypothetical protein